MERIQYAKTSDGVNIAYSVMGEGPPLLHLGWFPLSHLQVEWEITPEIRPWYERLAEKRMLVRYDGRGTGLSERDVTDFSVDARMLDLETVVDRLGLERFALLGTMHQGPVAIAYAARHPDRVSHLVLWCAFARGTDFSRSPPVQGARAVLDKDWHTFTETAAHAIVAGWAEGELAQRVAVLFRESLTHEAMQAFLPQSDEADATDLLPHVKASTLVIHRRGLNVVPVDVARDLAVRIPGARLALVEGSSMLPYVGDMEAALRIIEEFLASEPVPKSGLTPARAAGGLVTILFTDVEGSTAITQRLGDARAREVLREHERITRECLRAHGGSEVKTMGDGFMASFGSATKALECATAIQQALGDHEPGGIRVRIGLNAGEPIAEDDDLHGTAVITAARIAALAHGGEILVSDVVRQLVAGKGFLFNDRGDHALKGFEDPVRVWEVKLQRGEK